MFYLSLMLYATWTKNSAYFSLKEIYVFMIADAVCSLDME